MEVLIDTFIDYGDGKYIPELEEWQDDFTIEFLHINDNTDPLQMFDDMGIRFKEYTGYGNNIEGW
jgi:hypothetical protein